MSESVALNMVCFKNASKSPFTHASAGLFPVIFPTSGIFFLLNWEKVFDNEFHASASPPTRMASVAPHLNTTADEMSWNIHLQSYSPLVCSEDLALYTFWRFFS